MIPLLADPAPVIVGWSLIAIAAVAAFIAIVGAWDHRPRTESRSERNHRIDAEALAACEPPVIWSGGNTLPDYDANVAAFDRRGVTR